MGAGKNTKGVMGRNRNNNSQQCTYYDDDLLFQLGYYTGGNLSWFCCPTRSLVNRIWAGTFRILACTRASFAGPCAVRPRQPPAFLPPSHPGLLRVA
jgi:hypothetical protein